MRQRTSLGSSIQSHHDKIYIVLWFLNTIVAKMRRLCMANKKHKSIVLYNAIWLKMNHMQSQLSLKSLFVKKIPREILSQITTNVNSKMILQIMNIHFANTCYNTCNYDTQNNVWFLIMFTRISYFIEIECLQVFNIMLYFDVAAPKSFFTLFKNWFW